VIEDIDHSMKMKKMKMR